MTRKINMKNYRDSGTWIKSSRLYDDPSNRVNPARIGVVMPAPFESYDWAASEVFRLSDYEQNFDYLHVVDGDDFETANRLLDCGATIFAGHTFEGCEPIVSYEGSEDVSISRLDNGLTLYQGPVGDYQARLIRHAEALLKLQLSIGIFELLDNTRLSDIVCELSLGKIEIDPSDYFDGSSRRNEESRLWAVRYLWSWISNDNASREEDYTILPDLDPAGLDDIRFLAHVYERVLPDIDLKAVNDAKSVFSRGMRRRNFFGCEPFQGSTTSVKAARILADGAKKAGLESYLDAYLEGVPASDIIA